MRTAKYEVSKFVLQSTTQVMTKRNPDNASLRAWMLLDHSLHTQFPISIHNTDTAPCQRRNNIRHCSSHSRTKHPTSNIRRRNSPCMVQTSPCLRRSKNHIATLHPCQCCTMSETKQNPTSQLSVRRQQRQTRSKSEQNQSSQLSFHEPNMYSHTRRAAYFFA